MSNIHKNLNEEKWHNFSKETQILNIASEFSRAKNWLIKQDTPEVINCLERALELVDITINDKKWRNGLKELLRWRGLLAIFYLKKDKSLPEFLNLFKTLLFFNKFTSQIKI
ncbi:MAG: hypothetical protein WCZ99_00115 [Candidatus Paceibacterota bacterium]